MDKLIFPCIICDQQKDGTCVADVLGRKVWETDGCPLGLQARGKPDVGSWVVVQPDGMLCYYDEKKMRLLARDLTLEQMCSFREQFCAMGHDHAEQDTLQQIQFHPITWEDIPDFLKKD